MSTKKSFKENNPALSFISAAVPMTQVKAETQTNTLPNTEAVFHNRGEAKTRRVQLLLKPSTHDALKQLAQFHSTSVNDTINTILEHYLKKEI